MKVDIKINADYQEPLAVIHTAEITDERTVFHMKKRY